MRESNQHAPTGMMDPAFPVHMTAIDRDSLAGPKFFGEERERVTSKRYDGTRLNDTENQSVDRPANFGQFKIELALALRTRKDQVRGAHTANVAVERFEQGLSAALKRMSADAIVALKSP